MSSVLVYFKLIFKLTEQTNFDYLDQQYTCYDTESEGAKPKAGNYVVWSTNHNSSGR